MRKIEFWFLDLLDNYISEVPCKAINNHVLENTKNETITHFPEVNFKVILKYIY